MEDKWFKPPTWAEGYDIDRFKIEFIVPRMTTNSLVINTKKVLESNGFKEVEKAKRQLRVIGFELDMVEKTFQFYLDSRLPKKLLKLQKNIHRIYPSQLNPLLEKYRGRLTGKKFGL